VAVSRECDRSVKRAGFAACFLLAMIVMIGAEVHRAQSVLNLLADHD